MPGIEQSAIALTEGILRIPYFWNAPGAEQLDGNRNNIHLDLMDLVAQEQKREREALWQKVEARLTGDEEGISKANWEAEWNTRWRFNAARQQELIQRHPLAVRMAGRGVMVLNNTERLDERGQLLKVGAARSCRLVSLGRIASLRPEEPSDVVLHLRQAGYLGIKAKVNARTLPHLLGREIPEDAIDYMEAYPPAILPQPGEKNRATMRTEFDASDNMLIGIIEEQGLYPIVRRFEGRGGREAIFYSAPNVATIERAVLSLPRLSPRSELPFSVVIPMFGTADMFRTVLSFSQIETPYRRLPGQGRGQIIHKQNLPELRRIYRYLTTLQPGEQGYEEIAAELGVSLTAARSAALQIDIDASRPLWPKKNADLLYPRRVFPEETTQRIKARILSRLSLSPRVIAAMRRERKEAELLTKTPGDETASSSATEIPAQAEVEVEEVPEPTKEEATSLETAVVVAQVADSTQEKVISSGPEIVVAEMPEPLTKEDAPPVVAVPETTEPVTATLPQKPAPVTSQTDKVATKAIDVLPEEEDEPLEPKPHWPVTLTQLGGIMRAQIRQVNKAYFATQPPRTRLSVTHLNELGKLRVDSARAAVMARTILSEYLAHMPSFGATIEQIALIVNYDPDYVVDHLVRSRVLPAGTTRGDRIANQQLKTVFEHFGVSLG